MLRRLQKGDIDPFQRDLRNQVSVIDKPKNDRSVASRYLNCKSVNATSAGAPIRDFDTLNPAFPIQRALDQTVNRLNPKTDTFAAAVFGAGGNKPLRLRLAGYR